MNNLEQITNRYLDGELSPAELAEYQALLENSSEARQLLENLELIRSAARSFPEISTPEPTLESGLFQKLFAEEDWTAAAVEKEEKRRRAGLIPLFRSGLEGIAAIGAGRAALAIPAFVLLFLFGNRFLQNDAPQPSSDEIAAVTAPASPERPGSSAPENAGITPAGADQIATSSTLSPNGGTDDVSVVLVEDRAHNPVQMQNPSSSAQQAEESRDEAPTAEDPGSVPYAQADPTRAIEDRSPRSSTPDSKDPITTHRDAASTFASTDHFPQFEADDFERPEPLAARTSVLSASYRHGLSSFFGEKEAVLASGQDLNLRIDGQIADRHRVSVVVGSSPVLVAERTYTTVSSTSPDPNDDRKGPNDPSPASVTIDKSNRTEGEVWAGVGYGYTLFRQNNLRVEAGLSAGYGEESTRYGLEIPARLAVTDRLGVEVVPYVTRIVPRDQDIRSASTFESYQEEWRPSSTSVGAQVGVSLSIY